MPQLFSCVGSARVSRATPLSAGSSRNGVRALPRIPMMLFALLAVAAPGSLVAATDEYPPHRDSVVQPGVPKGELIKFEFAGSKILPGTTREVTVYVPKQY